MEYWSTSSKRNRRPLWMHFGQILAAAAPMSKMFSKPWRHCFTMVNWLALNAKKDEVSNLKQNYAQNTLSRQIMVSKLWEIALCTLLCWIQKKNSKKMRKLTTLGLLLAWPQHNGFPCPIIQMMMCVQRIRNSRCHVVNWL